MVDLRGDIVTHIKQRKGTIGDPQPRDTSARHNAEHWPRRPREQHLRLLSYNIQAGIDTRRYTDYLTQSWRHLLPDPRRFRNLDNIAALLSRFDLVGLQEVDGGSLRSGFVNQVQYLAAQGKFPLWYRQVNRHLGKLGQHSNGLLTRLQPSDVTSYRLPGRPGRGAILARFEAGGDELGVITTHLSLRRASRLRQLGFLSEMIRQFDHVVVMGDLNCQHDSPELRLLMGHSELCAPRDSPLTFPSWQPVRGIDHILTSPSLRVSRVRSLGFWCSDHLPLTAEVVLPDSLDLRPAHAGKHSSALALDSGGGFLKPQPPAGASA